MAAIIAIICASIFVPALHTDKSALLIMMLFIALFLCSLLSASDEQPARIGIIFHKDEPWTQTLEYGGLQPQLRSPEEKFADFSAVVNSALSYAKEQRLIHPKLQIDPLFVDAATILNIADKACRLLSMGVVALVAPPSCVLGPVVAAIGERYGVLTILPNAPDDGNDNGPAVIEVLASKDTLSESSLPRTRKIPVVSIPSRKLGGAFEPGSTGVPAMPRRRMIAHAIETFINRYRWESFTLVYEDPLALVYLEGLMHLNVPQGPTDYLTQIESGGRPGFSMSGRSSHIVLRHLVPNSDGEHLSDGEDYREALQDFRESGLSRFVIDCSVPTIERLLKQAHQVGMLNAYFHYHFVSLDADLVDYSEYYKGGANITFFRLPNFDYWRSRIQHNALKNQPINSTSQRLLSRLTSSDAFLFDGVVSAVRAMSNLSRIQKLDTGPVACTDGSIHVYKASGEGLVNYMQTTENLPGAAGPIRYTEARGWRSPVTLELARLNKLNGSLESYAEWRPGPGLSGRGGELIMRDIEYGKSERDRKLLQNQKLIATTIIEDPFVIFRKPAPGEIPEGNARFDGYCIDLLEKLSEMLHFKYEIHLVEDRKYGAPIDASGQRWNGLVGELLSKHADLALAPLTITYAREQVIDFSTPFMNLGISILFRRPVPDAPTIFSFLKPLDVKVWIFVIGATVATSIFLYVVGRVSPYEWVQPPACLHDPASTTVMNQFTVLNSFWFTISSLLQHSSDIAPRACSTRIIATVWSFFTLMIIASYTANLAAFLTSERLNTPITSADDLSRQTEIKYGTVYGGSTMAFFKNSKIPTYEKMWQTMHANRDVFVNSSAQGIAKVKAGGYAYLMESIMIEYQVQRECDLMQIGGLLDSKGYGIGLPRGSPIREEISNAILRLQDEQFLHLLKARWFVEKAGLLSCNSVIDSKPQLGSQLGIRQVGGVFALVTAGIILGICLAFLEFYYHSRGQRKTDAGRQSWIAKLCSRCTAQFDLLRVTGKTKAMVPR